MFITILSKHIKKEKKVLQYNMQVELFLLLLINKERTEYDTSNVKKNNRLIYTVSFFKSGYFKQTVFLIQMLVCLYCTI